MAGGALKLSACLAALLVAFLAAPELASAGSPVAHHVGRRGVTVRHHAGHARSPGTPIGTSSLSGTTPDYPGQLVYHGGPVLKSTKVYAMYWFPAGYTLDSTWQQTIDGWLGDVAAASGSTSNVFSAVTQYGAGYSAQVGGSAQDTTPFPTSNCDAAPVCLTETQIFNELNSFAASQGWEGDPGVGTRTLKHLFLVYLPPGVADCFDPDPGQTQSSYCSATAGSSRAYYCAYHTAWSNGSSTFVWANLPYTWDNGGCQSGNFPNGAAADTAIDVTSHEYLEAVTDPYLTSWWDANGYEVADKCQTEYGTWLGGLSGSQWNQQVNGHDYSLQLEYSNKTKLCYQVGAPAVTSFTPKAGDPGATITITGKNFFGPAIVRFNGIASTGVNVVSPTEIQATLPAGSVKGKITVQAIGGQGTSATAFFPPPTVTALGDDYGKAGNTVVVTGSSLGGATKVKFGSVAAVYTVDSDTQITATVPAGFSAGRISVVTPGGAGSSRTVFYVSRLAGVTAAAAAGKTIALTGQGLDGVDQVFFTGHAGAVTPQSATARVVKVVVPNDAQLGPVGVKAPLIDQLDTTRSFKPTPSIAALDPGDGIVGATVTITGANFANTTQVRFASLDAPYSYVSPTEIDATVPAGFVSGRISVSTSAGRTVSPAVFAVPKVTRVSPLAAPANAVVTISGAGLGSTSTVDFSNHPGVVPILVRPTFVKVQVPADAANGQLVVNTATTAIDTVEFKPRPVIASFDPPDGFSGTSVTITGTNFYGPTTVKFGSTASPSIVVDSPTQITAAVPDGFTSGRISVLEPGGAGVSAQAFAVTRVTGVSPANAAAGQTVTVTGVGLADVSSVHFFPDLAATPTNRTATSFKVVVPAGATSGDLFVFTPAGNVESPKPLTVSFSVTSLLPGAATHDHDLTLGGVGLTGVTSVTINGLACDITSIAADGTSLHVTTPSTGDLNGPVLVTKRIAGVSHTTSAGDFVEFAVTSSSTSTGYPGSSLVFTGTGMTGVTGVAFGSVAGTIDSVSATEVDVTVPSGVDPGAVDVVLSGDGGNIDIGTFTIVPHIASFTPSHAGSSMQVVITGSGFLGATSVKVASSPAEWVFTVDSATQITATVPGNVGAGHFIVTTPNGTAESSTDFTYDPPPNVDSLSAASGTAGDTIVITGSHFTGATDVSFNGTSATFTVDSDTQITVTVPTGATTGKVSVTTPDGTGQSASDFTVV